MAIKIVNRLGVISIENEIIERLAAIAARDCFGVAGLAAKDGRGGKVIMLDNDDYEKGVSIKIENNALNIDIHVIAEYGANLQAIGTSAIEKIKDRVSAISGVKVNEVGFYVEGVKMD